MCGIYVAPTDLIIFASLFDSIYVHCVIKILQTFYSSLCIICGIVYSSRQTMIESLI